MSEKYGDVCSNSCDYSKSEIKQGFKKVDTEGPWAEVSIPEVLTEEDNSGFLGRRTGLATERI